eukprot:c26042_g1_i1 orf=336-1571(-)
MPHGVRLPAIIPSVGPTRGWTETIFVRQQYCSCFITLVALWLLVTITVSMGYYQSRMELLGSNSSKLFTFSPWLVGEFKVNDNGRVGPMLYGFDTQPDLDIEASWTEKHNANLDPGSHQEFTMWLNKGSKITLNCSIYSSGFPGILVAILQGYGKLQEWTADPKNFRVTPAWKDVHGNGSLLEFKVSTDDNHYIAVYNLNHESVEIILQFEIRAMVYNTSTSRSRCSLQSKSCKLKISYWGQKYALLTTPSNSQNGSNVWEMHLSYGVRWFSFWIGLAGIQSVIAMALIFIACLNSETLEVSATSTDTLLRPKNSPEDSTSSYGSIGQDPTNGLQGYGWTNVSGEEMHEPEICAVCFDASRNSFFIPCGHCATCISCALKIQNGVGSRCPICREKIQEVRRMMPPTPNMEM